MKNRESWLCLNCFIGDIWFLTSNSKIELFHHLRKNLKTTQFKMDGSPQLNTQNEYDPSHFFVSRVCFISHKGTYLSVDHTNTVTWTSPVCEENELFTMSAAPRFGFVTIRTSHGKFLSVSNGELHANRELAFEDEFFTIGPAPEQGKYTLKSITGRFVSVQKNGDIEVNRLAAQHWEFFKIEVRSQHPEFLLDVTKEVAFRSQDGRYLSAQPDGTVEWNRTECRGWELFSIVTTSREGYMAFRTEDGKYLKVGEGEGVVTGNIFPEESTYFVVERAKDEKYRVRSVFGMYLVASSDGGVRLKRGIDDDTSLISIEQC
ncbi:hypothetical protein EIN_022550 [Entamoeba invadens IP1]|uniref:hypothetical protein n=1 Tax=Entamoeba invadens IP1 TaxID=370355 RepID=UPI0002C3DF42|nr:hypothetical protein EIN_022550 [Entamoeba invadens IP1]ELP90636.1 hypothetical protein EIN_022550 [Entamoeba invadens IP1]|eukprot:XP_004257407.1 hypothetical protein EIN_022550 [Entamoeba invadens IP1]